MRSQVTRRLEFRGLSLVNKRGRSFLHRNGFPFSRCVHAITRGLSDRWNNKIPGGGEWREGNFLDTSWKWLFVEKIKNSPALKICFKKEKGITFTRRRPVVSNGVCRWTILSYTCCYKWCNKEETRVRNGLRINKRVAVKVWKFKKNSLTRRLLWFG